MHWPIVARILAATKAVDAPWVMHLFRMGFDEADMPVVVQVLVPRGALLDSNACTLVGEIGAIIAAEWLGEA